MSHRDDLVFSNLNFRSERYFWGTVFAFRYVHLGHLIFGSQGLIGLISGCEPSVIIYAIAKTTSKQDNSIKIAY